MTAELLVDAASTAVLLRAFRPRFVAMLAEEFSPSRAQREWRRVHPLVDGKRITDTETSRRCATLPRSSGQEVNVRLAGTGPSQPTSRPAGRSLLHRTTS